MVRWDEEGRRCFQGRPEFPLSVCGRLTVIIIKNRINLWIDRIHSTTVDMAFATGRYASPPYWSSFEAHDEHVNKDDP